MRLPCTVIYRPERITCIRGTVVKCDKAISLLGDLDFRRCVMKCCGSEMSLPDDAVLCYPRSIGSTVGPYALYALRKTRGIPLAIVCLDPDILTVIGAVLCDIPVVKVQEDVWNKLTTGSHIVIDLENSVFTLAEDAD